VLPVAVSKSLRHRRPVKVRVLGVPECYLVYLPYRWSSSVPAATGG
jgi:hypothetical protein